MADEDPRPQRFTDEQLQDFLEGPEPERRTFDDDDEPEPEVTPPRRIQRREEPRRDDPVDEDPRPADPVTVDDREEPDRVVRDPERFHRSPREQQITETVGELEAAGFGAAARDPGSELIAEIPGERAPLVTRFEPAEEQTEEIQPHIFEPVDDDQIRVRRQITDRDLVTEPFTDLAIPDESLQLARGAEREQTVFERIVPEGFVTARETERERQRAGAEFEAGLFGRVVDLAAGAQLDDFHTVTTTGRAVRTGRLAAQVGDIELLHDTFTDDGLDRFTQTIGAVTPVGRGIGVGARTGVVAGGVVAGVGLAASQQLDEVDVQIPARLPGTVDEGELTTDLPGAVDPAPEPVTTPGPVVRDLTLPADLPGAVDPGPVPAEVPGVRDPAEGIGPADLEAIPQPISPATPGELPQPVQPTQPTIRREAVETPDVTRRARDGTFVFPGAAAVAEPDVSIEIDQLIEPAFVDVTVGPAEVVGDITIPAVDQAAVGASDLLGELDLDLTSQLDAHSQAISQATPTTTAIQTPELVIDAPAFTAITPPAFPTLTPPGFPTLTPPGRPSVRPPRRLPPIPLIDLDAPAAPAARDRRRADRFVREFEFEVDDDPLGVL